MIPTNIIYRIFRVNHNGSEGVAFTLDVDRRQYLVTARHVIDTAVGVPIRIFHDGKWATVGITPVPGVSADVDIAVFAPGTLLTDPGLTLEPSSGHMFLGQDGFIFGFPEIATHGNNVPPDSKFPTPFVKKISFSYVDNGADGIQRIYLSGQSNPGFSGSPVYFMDLNTRQHRVCAVLHGQIKFGESVTLKDQPTELDYTEDQGFILTYGIKHAVEAIQRNPIGLPLPSA
jgi:Trypsin-like peptidase domain